MASARQRHDQLDGQVNDEAAQMTVVAIWFKPEDDALWAVADTRISSKTNDGVTVSTDSALKDSAQGTHRTTAPRRRYCTCSVLLQTAD